MRVLACVVYNSLFIIKVRIIHVFRIISYFGLAHKKKSEKEKIRSININAIYDKV